MDYVPQQSQTPNQKLDETFTQLVDVLGRFTRQVLDPQSQQADEKDRWLLKDTYYTTLSIAGEGFKPLPDDDYSILMAINSFIDGLKRKGYYKVGVMEAPL